jgi:hypothetical protein
VPLYPEEVDQVFAAEAVIQEVVPIVQAYTTTRPDESGGLYIDRDLYPGLVTALFTGRIEVHEAALRERLGPDLPFRVREVAYTHAELRRLQDVIAAEWDASWVADIPARMEGVGVDISENVISVDISSAEPDAAAIIADHFDLGDRLRIVSDGTGAALIPYGTVVGRVRTADGREPGYNEWLLDAVSDEPGSCGGGDMGFGIREDGTFEYPCQAGRRTIQVKEMVGDGEWRVIGERTVVVESDRKVRVTITLAFDP